jgi:type I restriction enzyme M protein
MANTQNSKSIGLISSEYTNPVDAMSYKILNIFDVYRVNPSLNDDESTQIVLLFVSLYNDGLVSSEIVNRDFSVSGLKSSIIASNLKEDSKGGYLSVINVLNESLSKIINQSLDYLCFYLFEIEKELLTKYFPAIFDDVIYRIAKSQGRYTAEFNQPIELTSFINSLVELKKDAKVFNPFAGVASFGINLNGNQSYIGQEMNQKTWVIGVLRLMAYAKLANTKYENTDSIEYWPSDDQTFDLIVSNPPLNSNFGNQYKWHYPEIKTAEQFIIEKGISSLNVRGKLIAVLSNGFLFRGGAEQRLRERLIDSDLIETIISLPGGLLMHTGIPIIILVINKDKKLHDKVRIIDAQSFTITKGKREIVLDDDALSSRMNIDTDSEFVRIVSNDQIRKFDYILNVPLYFQKTYEGVKLSEIVSVISGQRNYEEQSGKFIRIRDLKEDKIDFQLETNSIEVAEIPKAALKINTSCLLVAIRWKTLKPTYFAVTNEPIFVTPDIISLRADVSKVDIAYLINELQADYISEQIDSYRIGVSVPSIRKDDLLKVIIKLPSLPEQRAKLKGITEAMAEQKKADLISFSKIHGLEKEVYEQNTHLRHTLAGPTSNLVNSLANIKSIIIDKIAPIYPEILGQKVSDDHLFSLADYLDIVERDALKISETVRQQLKVYDIFESKLLSPVDIIDFLKVFFSEKSENNSLDFTFEINFEKVSFFDDISETEINTVILASVDLLSEMFNNLIENAVKHAFSAGYKNRIDVYVMKNNVAESNPEVQILFSNTGKPFPEDFGFDDFIRKGSKSGTNAGDGYGGWYINEIIKYHKGSFDLINEKGPEGLLGTDLVTSFEINFPIIEIDEKI